MKLNVFQIGVLTSAIFLGVCRGSSVDLPAVDYQPEALSNSLRCVRTIRGDEYRIALTQNFVSENLGHLNLPNQAYAILKESVPHYALSFGCAETSLIFLGKGNISAARNMVSLGLDLLPYSAGRGGELVQFQLLKIAAVIGDLSAVQRALEAEKMTKVDLHEAYRFFLNDWKPNFWNRMLDFIKLGGPWSDMPKDLGREGEMQWHAKRNVDIFTAILFLKECEGRVLSGQKYPAHLVRFASAGANSQSFNTRSASVETELAKLAFLEKKSAHVLRLIEDAGMLLTPWAPHMSGIYPIERDLAVLISKQQVEGVVRQQFIDRLVKRMVILQKVLDPYEQMIQLPFLAEAFYVLGFDHKAKEAWSTAADLCAKNQNPESQSIGLTRIWMSYARANCLPEKAIGTLLQKIESKLSEEYSKVHF